MGIKEELQICLSLNNHTLSYKHSNQKPIKYSFDVADASKPFSSNVNKTNFGYINDQKHQNSKKTIENKSQEACRSHESSATTKFVQRNEGDARTTELYSLDPVSTKQINRINDQSIQVTSNAFESKRSGKNSVYNTSNLGNHGTIFDSANNHKAHVNLGVSTVDHNSTFPSIIHEDEQMSYDYDNYVPKNAKIAQNQMNLQYKSNYVYHPNHNNNSSKGVGSMRSIDQASKFDFGNGKNKLNIVPISQKQSRPKYTSLKDQNVNIQKNRSNYIIELRK